MASYRVVHNGEHIVTDIQANTAKGALNQAIQELEQLGHNVLNLSKEAKDELAKYLELKGKTGIDITNAKEGDWFEIRRDS